MISPLRRDPVDIAAEHLAAGRTAEAKTIYEQVLRDQPSHARALCGLGGVAMRGGETDRAFELISCAASIAPRDGHIVGNLAVVYLARQELQAAEDCCRRALDLEPEMADLHANLANVLLARGDTVRALEAQHYAIGLDPDSAAHRFNLGNILMAIGKPGAAAAEYENALALDQDHVGSLNNLSMLHKQAGRIDVARSLLDEARLHDPLNPELMANHADLLLRTGKPKEAVDEMRRAVNLSPQHPQLRAALGAMLLEVGRLSEAAAELATALRAAPSEVRTTVLLARLLRRQGRLDAAQTAIDRAIDMTGAGPVEQAMAAELLMLRGRYAEAWQRLAPIMDQTGPRLNVPNLSPEADLKGQAVRLIAMDAANSLFAARFVAVLAARGAELTVICPPPLAALFESVEGVTAATPTPNLDLAALVADGEPSAILDSLPCRMHVTPDEPATTFPVFRVPPAETPPATEGRRRVGVWWEGRGPGRTLPETLIGIEGIELVSLQTGAMRDAARALLDRPEIADHGGAIGDFRDLAAEIAAVDVMIVPDGPVAQLAGGLGVETWVLTDRDGSWNWGSDAQPSAWYPNSRTFQQSTDATWSAALDALRTALQPPVEPDVETVAAETTEEQPA